MQVGQLAQQLNITPDTVRFYTREGFLRPTKNRKNGYKQYSEQDLRRLRFIISARQLGFSVSDIEEIIEMADTGRTPCPLVRKLIDQRLHETEKQFRDMSLLRQRMSAAVAEWAAKPNRSPTGKMVCHLIEEFAL